MIIELFASGTEVPALYDAFIDKEGNLYGMEPAADRAARHDAGRHRECERQADVGSEGLSDVSHQDQPRQRDLLLQGREFVSMPASQI